MWGENLAVAWYRRNGWQIIGRNVHHGRGEIDIIARRHDVIAVCEVKTRATEQFGFPAEAMTVAKCRSVRVAAFGWAKDNSIATWRLRFDLAVVTGTKIEVFADAF